MSLWRWELLGLICDAWLIRYADGSDGIPPHTDPVEGKRHWRINVVYQDCVSGGDLICPTALINWRRLKVFRSDREHAVSPVVGGERRVLSIGFAF